MVWSSTFSTPAGSSVAPKTERALELLFGLDCVLKL